MEALRESLSRTPVPPCVTLKLCSESGPGGFWEVQRTQEKMLRRPIVASRGHGLLSVLERPLLPVLSASTAQERVKRLSLCIKAEEPRYKPNRK